MSPFRLLFLTLLGVSLLPGCGSRGGRGGSGDDDSAAGDDDTTPQGDDDDTTPQGDDDDTTPPGDDDTASGACTGSLRNFTESEPNDDVAGADSITAVSGPLHITGTLTDCANDGQGWIGNNDFFLVSLDCEGGDAEAVLDWSGSANDLDFRVSSADGATFFLEGLEFSTAGPEQAVGALSGGEFLISLLCWEGPDVSYSFDLTW